jgi:hypothetical protein
MPGVFRPYTAADIIGSLQDGIDAATSTDTSSNGLGYFGEADETAGFTDAVTATVLTANPAWDAGQWGSLAWG